MACVLGLGLGEDLGIVGFGGQAGGAVVALPRCACVV